MLAQASKALNVYNEGRMYEESEPVYVVGRCKPYATSSSTISPYSKY
jgi:hypothetical protein